MFLKHSSDAKKFKLIPYNLAQILLNSFNVFNIIFWWIIEILVFIYN